MEASINKQSVITPEMPEEIQGQVKPNQVIDTTSFETEPEELAVNQEYIHLRELDLEMHLGIFSL